MKDINTIQFEEAKVWAIVNNSLHLSMVLHMKEDLLVKEFELNSDDLNLIEAITV